MSSTDGDHDDWAVWYQRRARSSSPDNGREGEGSQEPQRGPSEPKARRVRAPTADDGTGSDEDDDSDGNQQAVDTQAERKNIRGLWEMAAVLNFLGVFKDELGLSDFTAGELESSIIQGPESELLQEIHIAFLQALHPRTKITKESWVPMLAGKMRDFWKGNAAGELLFNPPKGEEAVEYAVLPPVERVRVLRVLCELRLECWDISERIDLAIKPKPKSSKVPQQGGLEGVDSFRERVPFAVDASGKAYWLEDRGGRGTVTTRLYAETIRDYHATAGGGLPTGTVRVADVAEEVEDEDDIPCEVCGERDREDDMLLCDNEDTCNRGWHFDCAGLDEKPGDDDDFVCPTCVEDGGGKCRGGAGRAACGEAQRGALPEDEDDIPCEVCGERDREDDMLLCDNEDTCNRGWHFDCAGLDEKPGDDDDFVCPKCLAPRELFALPPPAELTSWDVVATSAEELAALGSTLSASQEKKDKALGKLLTEKLAPELEEREHRAARQRKALDRQRAILAVGNVNRANIMDDSGRSRRARKVVNYSELTSFFDEEIEKAIRGDRRPNRGSSPPPISRWNQPRSVEGLRRGRSALGGGGEEPQLDEIQNGLPASRRSRKRMRVVSDDDEEEEDAEEEEMEEVVEEEAGEGEDGEGGGDEANGDGEENKDGDGGGGGVGDGNVEEPEQGGGGGVDDGNREEREQGGGGGVDDGGV